MFSGFWFCLIVPWLPIVVVRSSKSVSVIVTCAEAVAQEHKLSGVNLRSHTEAVLDTSVTKGSVHTLPSSDKSKFRIGNDLVVPLGSIAPKCEPNGGDKLELEAAAFRVRVVRTFGFWEARNAGWCNEEPSLVTKYDARKQHLCVFTNVFAVLRKADRTVRELVAVDFLLKTFACEFVADSPHCTFSEGFYQRNQSCSACELKVRAVNWDANVQVRQQRVLTIYPNNSMISQPVMGQNGDEMVAKACPVGLLDADSPSSARFLVHTTASINHKSTFALCYATVEIRVLDENDNSPQLTVPQNEVFTCNRNQSAVEQLVIMELLLQDHDSANNALVELKVAAMEPLLGLHTTDLVTFPVANVQANSTGVHALLQLHLDTFCSAMRSELDDGMRRSAYSFAVNLVAMDFGTPRLADNKTVTFTVRFPEEAQSAESQAFPLSVAIAVLLVLTVVAFAWLLHRNVKANKKISAGQNSSSTSNSSQSKAKTKLLNTGNGNLSGLGGGTSGHGHGSAGHGGNSSRGFGSSGSGGHSGHGHGHSGSGGGGGTGSGSGGHSGHGLGHGHSGSGSGGYGSGIGERGNQISISKKVMKLMQVTPSTSVQSTTSTQTAVNSARVFYHYHYHQHSLREPFHP